MANLQCNTELKLSSECQLQTTDTNEGPADVCNDDNDHNDAKEAEEEKIRGDDEEEYDNNDDDDDINDEKHTAPSIEFQEGGWGWIVVMACFFNSFILDGIGSSYGVLYPYVLQKFNASAFVTSFAGSMFGAYLIMGSVAAFLIKKFGFRAVSFAGGVLSCLGLIGASYSSNIYLFLLSYGVLGGTAVGLVYLSSMVIVNNYFNKKRGVTNGIISSGSGVGLLVIAPVTNALLETYSLSGSLLILAGVLLNICVFSSCFRNPKIYSNNSTKHIRNRKEVEREDTTEESSIHSYDISDPLKEQMEPCINTDIQPENDSFDLCPEVVIIASVDSHNHLKPEKIQSKRFLFHELRSNRSLTAKLPSHDTYSKSSLQMFSENQLSNGQKLFTHHSTYALAEKDKLRSRKQATKSNFSLFGIKHSIQKLRLANDNHSTSVFSDIGANSYLTSSISKLMQIHNQQFSSVHDLPTKESNSQFNDQICDNISSLNTDSKLPHKDNNIQNLTTDVKHFTSHSSIHSHNTSVLQDNISLSEEVPQEFLGYSIGQLLRMLPFHLFCIGACLIQFGYPVPGIFLADLAASHGISSQFGAIMISLIGSFNVIGRLLGGALGNLNINPLRLNNIAMLVAAVLCFLCPLFTTSWALCLFASLYGFLLGFFPPLQPLVIVKYFGIGSLASTFGFVTTLKGFAGLIGPPLAGWIYDVTHDYSISIMSAGVVFLLSVIINEILVHIIDNQLK